MRPFDFVLAAAGRSAAAIDRLAGGRRRVWYVVTILFLMSLDPGAVHRVEPATDRPDLRGRPPRADPGDDDMGATRGRPPAARRWRRRPVQAVRPQGPEPLPLHQQRLVASARARDRDGTDLADTGRDRQRRHDRSRTCRQCRRPTSHSRSSSSRRPSRRSWRSGSTWGTRSGVTRVGPRRRPVRWRRVRPSLRAGAGGSAARWWHPKRRPCPGHRGRRVRSFRRDDRRARRAARHPDQASGTGHARPGVPYQRLRAGSRDPRSDGGSAADLRRSRSPRPPGCHAALARPARAQTHRPVAPDATG